MFHYTSKETPGSTIEDQLNFNIHINEMCKRASQLRVGVMMRLKKFILTNAKLTLYKSAILPYLTYCHDLTWHLCTACNKRKLERMQERALRALFLNGRFYTRDALSVWTNLGKHL